MTIHTDPPVVVFVPEDPLFEEGGTLMLKCCAQGKPLPSYAWRRLDEEMTSKAVGTTSRHLFIPNTTMSDIGVYACVAINEGGIAQSSSIQTFFRSYGKMYKNVRLRRLTDFPCWFVLLWLCMNNVKNDIIVVELIIVTPPLSVCNCAYNVIALWHGPCFINLLLTPRATCHWFCI